MPLTNPAPAAGTTDHDALSNVSANDHHNQAHAIDGADHTGTLAIAQIPTGTTGTTVALGNAAAGLFSTHEGAADPHTGYLKESDANWVDLTDGGATILHSHSSSHPDLATHDAMGLATDTELANHAAAADPHTGYLKENDASWTDLTDGGGTTLHSHANPSVNFSTAAQAITANTVTYLTGSGILIPSGGLAAGQMYRWYIGVTKTAAGVATPIWTPRIGTNQSTADGTVLTITGTAQVATASGTLIIITCLIRTASATGVVVGSINTGAASFGIGGNVVSGAYDTTGKAGQRFGLAVNTGASAAWTVQAVEGEVV